MSYDSAFHAGLPTPILWDAPFAIPSRRGLLLIFCGYGVLPSTPAVRAFVFSPGLWPGVQARGMFHPIPLTSSAAYLAHGFTVGYRREDCFLFFHQWQSHSTID